MKSKAQKQTEAKARQAAYAALKPAEKFQQIADRPGASTRERRRISDSTSPHKYEFVA